MFRFMGAIFSKTDLDQFMIKSYNSNLPFIKHNKDDSVFLAPWQGQLFAITVHMTETGYFTWLEFTYLFGNHLKLEKLFKFNEVTLDDRYYICWLNALEELIINKKLFDPNFRLRINNMRWRNNGMLSLVNPEI